jgi:uncharacterized phage protein (TIGR02218 family)
VRAIFRGDVVQVIFRQSDRKGTRHAEVTIDPLTAALARTGLIARYSRQCCVDLYDALCGVDRDDFEIQGTITAVAGNVLTSPLFGLKPNHWFRGGDILVRGCRRGITAHTGEEITIGRSLPEDVMGHPFSAWPGCDHLRTTCEVKFDDLENFRGQSNIPDEDVWSQWGIL